MCDCLVIGAGIIGMVTAKYLAEAGLSVVVLEKNDYGKESSWAGAGILSPLYPWRYSTQVNELSQQSQQIYPDFCQKLSQESGIDVGYRPSDLLIEDDYQTQAAKDWLGQYSAQYQLSSEGLLLKAIGQVRNPRLLKALAMNVAQLGVKIRQQSAVCGFTIKGNFIEAVLTQQESYQAQHIIICGGAWSGELLNLLPKSDVLVGDIYPMRGQILLLELPSSINLDTIIPYIILKDDKYLVPRADNLLLVGASYETVGFNKEITQSVREELHRFALNYLPRWAQGKIVKQWAGLRPASYSGKIYIEKSRHYQNLYFNAGHFSNGINTALASAKTLLNFIGT